MGVSGPSRDVRRITAGAIWKGRGIVRMMAENFARCVLVVDDEPLIRWSIAETLKEYGHTVLQADTGAAALRALQMSSLPLDAVVLDYRLPDTHDLSLLAWIRRIAPRTPVILITAFGTSELVAGALELGAYDVMEKPFDMNELEAVIARACEGR